MEKLSKFYVDAPFLKSQNVILLVKINTFYYTKIAMYSKSN